MTDESDVYICGICKKEFQDFVTFLQHKSSFGVFKCKLCNLSYHDREDIQKHINATHSNQKVDVAFTIPAKASLVNPRSDAPESTSDTQKTGYAMSVYTCRLCNRFTLVERSMLQHLQAVHKIHVAPGSVELAALMLCSKPLDSSSALKMPVAPVVVKTVTAPVASKLISRPCQTTATQTLLKMTDIEQVDSTDDLVEMSEDVDKDQKVDEVMIAEEQQVDLGAEWIELPEEVAEVSTTSVEDELETAAANVGLPGSSENDDMSDDDDDDDDDDGDPDDVMEPKAIKMTSILKTSMITYSKAKTLATAASQKTAASNPVVCIDGGHDYTSATMESTEEVVVKVEPVEQTPTIVRKIPIKEESPAVEAVTVTVVKDSGSSNVNIVKAEAPTQVKAVAPSLPKAKIVTIPPPKPAPAQKKSPKVIHVVMSPRASPTKTVSATPTKRAAAMVVSDDSEEEDFEEDPQPGSDGMYHCRRCKRAFARERQFKAHLNVHIMYGEHYLESPGGNRHDSKATPPSRKKTKLNPSKN